MTRLARFLRRLADRLDPLGTMAPAVALEPPREVVAVSRDEVRKLQADWLSIVQASIARARMCGQQDGMLWVERSTLQCLQSLIAIELEIREDDFAAVERDPEVRLR